MLSKLSSEYSYLILFTLFFSHFYSCEKPKVLHTVSVAQFRDFVTATNYTTDAEKYGWSIRQINVFDFDVVADVSWRCPDGELYSEQNYAVTQVSYNDALAYATWAEVKIPSYSEYWELVARDTRMINQNSSQILSISQTNVVGNVWDLTSPDQHGRIRLAGGSYLCNVNSCNGTDRKRELYVDQETGNTHIGFSVIK